MDPMLRSQIGYECSQLVYRFSHLFEAVHSQVADLFTEDGSLQIGGSSNIVVGAEAIREAMLVVENRAGEETNLLISNNVIVDVIDEDNATGHSYWTHQQHRTAGGRPTTPLPYKEPHVVGKFSDEYKRVNGEWKFAKRTFTGILIGAELLAYTQAANSSDG
ncbi:MAG: nuclear transport factor 2 family protein [Desulfobacterales bacterium]